MSEHWRAFGSLFFLAHQNRLLWLLNTPVIGWFLRRILRINGKSSSVGRRRITRILPHAIFWWEGDNQVAEFRTHAKFAKRLYYAFEPLWWTMHFWDWLVADRFVPRLSFGFAILQKNPDYHPETNTVDGYVEHTGVDVTWSTLTGGAGTTSLDDEAIGSIIKMTSSVSLAWATLRRAIHLYDTSSLTEMAVISAAVESIYGTSKTDGFSCTPNIDVYTSAPASNTALASGDYDSLGSVSQTGSPITYASWSTTGYNDFTYNSTGISNISKTGITKMGKRNVNYDIANSSPTWSSSKVSGVSGYYADQTGTSSDPKLVVTYTTGRISNARIILEARSDGTVTG